jgi:hypothetical protein
LHPDLSKNGEDNIVADTFSHYPILDHGEKQEELIKIELDDALNECLLHHFPEGIDAFPLNLKNIQAEQVAGQACVNLFQQQNYEEHIFMEPTTLSAVPW